MKKTLEQWEKSKGVVVNDASGSELKSQMTEEEFDKIPHTDKTGVNFEDRIRFLKDNGYEVTRKNLIDPTLSHREN